MNSGSLRDLVVDIHALDRELRRFEDKYSLLSEDFFTLYDAGRLRDESVNEIDEYGRWAALYRMRLRRKEQYDLQKTAVLKPESVMNPVTLEPYATSPTA